MAEQVAAAEIDETEIVLKLIGTEREREEGLHLAFKKHGRILFQFVVNKAPGLPTDCQQEAVLEALRALHSMAASPDFDPDKPLLPLLFTLTRRKTVDQLRKFVPRRQFEARLEDESHLASEVALRIMGTSSGVDWKLAVKMERATEIQESFRALIPTLPTVQRAVAQVMADALPGDLKDNEVADAIYSLTGSRPTVVQVRSARAQIRMKFAETVKRILRP